MLAHPGRTDENGGHTCWINCTKLGLEYGEYHYDGGSPISSSKSFNSSSSSSYHQKLQNKNKLSLNTHNRL
ncbi:YHYH domain-containing protein [Paenibacillus sp. CF095]|uniref:YHYH domain-containing protein n=1 Tax=Paenibacillus sp. CF095 TaxID=1881033 RepID=UPI002109C892|nr:YHYH domain-containing protein [Paenibacillus sp. CF095]